MNWKRILLSVIVPLFNGHILFAQPDKVNHAEPLFLDLVRDLGARKGEKEINIGADFIKGKRYNEQAYLIEYEFAPINRLGIEVEADIAIFTRNGKHTEGIPQNKWEALRLSSQYSFFVSTEINTTLAVGYTQIIEMADFEHYGKDRLITGTAFNPYFIAAKRWGANLHSLLYISPIISQHFETKHWSSRFQVNASMHYVFNRTKHFIGIELNQETFSNSYELTVRPQVKFKMSSRLAIGAVLGIPIHHTQQQVSSFVRVIYEL